MLPSLIIGRSVAYLSLFPKHTEQTFRISVHAGLRVSAYNSQLATTGECSGNVDDCDMTWRRLATAGEFAQKHRTLPCCSGWCSHLMGICLRLSQSANNEDSFDVIDDLCWWKIEHWTAPILLLRVFLVRNVYWINVIHGKFITGVMAERHIVKNSKNRSFQIELNAVQSINIILTNLIPIPANEAYFNVDDSSTIFCWKHTKFNHIYIYFIIQWFRANIR